MFLLMSAVVVFSKLIFYKSFRNTIRLSNGLDPDQYQCSVGPDLSPTVCKGYHR